MPAVKFPAYSSELQDSSLIGVLCFDCFCSSHDYPGKPCVLPKPDPEIFKMIKPLSKAMAKCKLLTRTFSAKNEVLAAKRSVSKVTQKLARTDSKIKREPFGEEGF